MLKKMILNIGGVSFVFGLIMLLASLSSIFLGRSLSPEEFGQFSLMRTLVLFIAPIAAWGQDVATARFFSQHPPAEFRWSRALRPIMGIGSALVFLSVIIAGIIYKLAWSHAALLLIASIAYLSTLFFSNLVRSEQNYRQSILMLNGFRGLFFLGVLVMYFGNIASAALAIYFYYLLIILAALLNAWYAFRAIPQGDKPVPRDMHTTGLLLMGSQTSITIIGSLDSLFIPGLLDLASLALYQAATVPAQIFNIVGRAGKYVWVPEFGRSKKVPVKKISLAVSLAAVALLAIMIAFAKPILHILFDGKYDDGANVLRILALAGAVRLYYNLVSSIIVGKLEKEALYFHLGINVVMVFVEIGLLIFMLKNYAVLGAALTMLIVTLLRTAGSYWIVWKFRRQLQPKPEAVVA